MYCPRRIHSVWHCTVLSACIMSDFVLSSVRPFCLILYSLKYVSAEDSTKSDRLGSLEDIAPHRKLITPVNFCCTGIQTILIVSYGTYLKWFKAVVRCDVNTYKLNIEYRNIWQDDEACLDKQNVSCKGPFSPIFVTKSIRKDEHFRKSRTLVIYVQTTLEDDVNM